MAVRLAEARQRPAGHVLAGQQPAAPHPRLSLVVKNLWPKLRTIVTIDWRMTSTGLMSDYILPAAGWYERTEHKW